MTKFVRYVLVKKAVPLLFAHFGINKYYLRDVFCGSVVDALDRNIPA